MSLIRLKGPRKKFIALGNTSKKGLSEIPAPLCLDRLLPVQGITNIRPNHNHWMRAYSEHHVKIISSYYFFRIISLVDGKRSLRPSTFAGRKHVVSAGQHHARALREQIPRTDMA